MMKYTDEQIDTFLETMGVELLPCQRELFKKYINNDGPIYITMPPRVGWTDYLHLREMMKIILEE